MHISRGLLPDTEKPRCRYHGNSMKIVKLDMPAMPGQKLDRNSAGRKIYRCKHVGCGWVCNGPCEIYHSDRDSSYAIINPW